VKRLSWLAFHLSTFRVVSRPIPPSRGMDAVWKVSCAPTVVNHLHTNNALPAKFRCQVPVPATETRPEASREKIRVSPIAPETLAPLVTSGD